LLYAPPGDILFHQEEFMDILKILAGVVIGGAAGFGLSYLSRHIGGA
jgi:hypothetical protein